jgi:hypothetical protein
LRQRAGIAGGKSGVTLTTALALLALLALLVARIALDFFDVPKALVALFNRTTSKMRPSVACMVLAGWLMLAGGVGLLVFALTTK